MKGSIEKRGTYSWRLRIDLGFHPDGTRNRPDETIKLDDPSLRKLSEKCKGYSDATRKLKDYLDDQLADFKQKVLKGEYIKPSKLTFSKFALTTWKENYANVKLGGYTRGNYMYLIKTHLIPRFGHMELSEIKTMFLVKYMTLLKAPEARKKANGKPLATSSQLNIYKALKAIFDAAYEWKIISSNPMDGVERPVADKKEKRAIRTRKKFYTKSEAMQLILALYKEPKRWRLYFIGVMLGGFRRGEMLGVEWGNVDFDNNSIYLETQITFDEDGKKIEDELKTEHSEGWIAMPKWYMDELRIYKEEWIEEMKTCPNWEGGKKQYVFHGGKGIMYFPTTPTTTWRKFLSRNELPHIRLHDLRHTTATLLRGSKVDLKAIQERLRHSKLSTTADLYTHETEEISREAADTFEIFDPENIVRPQSVPN